MTSVLSRLTPEITNQGRKKVLHRRGRTSTEPIIKIKGANINPTRVHGLRDGTGLQNDRVDGKCEENRAKRVALLNAPCAGNDLRSRRGGASEEDAVIDDNSSPPTESAKGNEHEQTSAQTTYGPS